MNSRITGAEQRPTAFGEYAKGAPAPTVTRVDGTVKAVARKLVVDPTAGRSAGFGQRRKINADPSGLMSRISNKTTGSIVDARNAMRLLPEIELSMTILVSSILSPKDLNTVELTYSQKNKVVSSEVAQQLLAILEEHFLTHHKLKDDLTPMLEDVLFKTGSYPMLVLAENTIDQIINGQAPVALESFSSFMDSTRSNFKHIGYLGNPTDTPEAPTAPVSGFGLESFSTAAQPEYNPAGKYVQQLSVFDNPNVLKLPLIRDRLRADTVSTLMRRAGIKHGVSNESAASDANALVQSLYRSPQYTASPNIAVGTTGSSNRATIGHPLVMKLPSESVIPVHEPSNPARHLGYFVLIDNGSPVFKSGETDYVNEIGALYKNNESMVSSILRDAKRINSGYNYDYKTTDAKQLESIYGDLIEYELNQRLMRGVYGSGATVARAEEVYRVMLHRTLAGKMTQLLYVPEEMLTYVAFDYDENGVGISLLQKGIALAAQLANLTVATTLAELKNCISRTKLTINLDEEDQDPSGTVEHIITEHAKLRRGAYPMMVFPPNDVVNMLQNAGVEIEVNGNTGYPATKVDITDYNSNKVLPNPDFMKSQRDRLIWSFGLPPELIDTSRGADFATSIVNNHLLMIKNVMHHQQVLTPLLEKFVRTYVLSDGILLERMREVINGAKGKAAVDGLDTSPAGAKDKIGGSDGNDVDRLLVDFLYNLQIDLPKPEGAKQKSLKEAYTEYKEFLESAIESWISNESLAGELVGKMGSNIDQVKNALIALWMRKWCRENGMSEPFDEILQLGENDAPGLDLFAEVQAHSSPILINLRDFLTKQMRRSAADDAVLTTVEEQTGAEAPGGSYDNAGSTADDAGGGGEFDMGGDFGDIGGDADDTADTADAATVSGEVSEETSESSSTETSADGTTTTTTSSSSSSSSTQQ